MSNTLKFAQKELEILVKSNTDPDNRPIIEKFIPEILALVDKFGHSGQSGGSAPYTASALSSAIEKLCMQTPICPIMGIDEEWTNVTDDNKPMYQNNRCYALFKDEDGEAYYLDAIIKKTQNDTTWSGSFWLSKEDYLSNNQDSKIRGRQYVRNFPFTPKTFYVDVIEEEVAPDDWEMFLIDKGQLDEIFEYYKPEPIKRKVLFEKEEKIL
jgi:hypothetical protein